jgi:hypothetical protein
MFKLNDLKLVRTEENIREDAHFMRMISSMRYRDLTFVCAPRQCGKSLAAVITSLDMVMTKPGSIIVWQSHNLGTAIDNCRRAAEIFMHNTGEKVERKSKHFLCFAREDSEMTVCRQKLKYFSFPNGSMIVPCGQGAVPQICDLDIWDNLGLFTKKPAEHDTKTIIIGAKPTSSLERWYFWKNGVSPVWVRWDEPRNRDEEFKQKWIKEYGEDCWKKEFAPELPKPL